VKPLPTIALNQDGPVTRCDLYPEEVDFLNYCRKHPHCMIENLQVVNGLPVASKQVIERWEYRGNKN